jgi:hypothetical protein
VQLYRRTSSGRRLIGRDRSGRDGGWKIAPDQLKPGAYFAKAKRKRGSVSCGPARSEVIVIE